MKTCLIGMIVICGVICGGAAAQETADIRHPAARKALEKTKGSGVLDWVWQSMTPDPFGPTMIDPPPMAVDGSTASRVPARKREFTHAQTLIVLMILRSLPVDSTIATERATISLGVMRFT